MRFSKPPASVVRQWREAAEPKHAAAAETGEFLVQDLERIAAAYRSHGDDGLERQMQRSIAYRARRPDDDTPPVMPVMNFGPRTSMYELRPSALTLVDEYGFDDALSLDQLRALLMANYDKIFGPFRRRGDPEVPSDQIKKEIMVEKLVRLIAQRRQEYAAERSNKPISTTAGCTP